MTSNIINSFHKLFNNRLIRRILQKIRILLCLVFLCVLILNIDPSYFFIGLIVSMVGEFIQLWCFASLNKKMVLSENGLYAIVRNPMYLGRYFLILGAIILFGNIWVIIIFSIIYYLYMINRVKREEETLQGIFGDSYKSYCARINRFIPRFRGIRLKSLWFFKWDLLIKNHGHWNFLALILTYLVFYYFSFIHR